MYLQTKCYFKWISFDLCFNYYRMHHVTIHPTLQKHAVLIIGLAHILNFIGIFIGVLQSQIIGSCFWIIGLFLHFYVYFSQDKLNLIKFFNQIACTLFISDCFVLDIIIQTKNNSHFQDFVRGLYLNDERKFFDKYEPHYIKDFYLLTQLCDTAFAFIPTYDVLQNSNLLPEILSIIQEYICDFKIYELLNYKKIKFPQDPFLLLEFCRKKLKDCKSDFIVILNET